MKRTALAACIMLIVVLSASLVLGAARAQQPVSQRPSDTLAAFLGTYVAREVRVRDPEGHAERLVLREVHPDYILLASGVDAWAVPLTAVYRFTAPRSSESVPEFHLAVNWAR